MERSMYKVFCLIVVVLSFVSTTVGQELGETKKSYCPQGTCTMTEKQLRVSLTEAYKKGYEKGFKTGYDLRSQSRPLSGFSFQSDSKSIIHPGLRWESFDKLINPGITGGVNAPVIPSE